MRQARPLKPISLSGILQTAQETQKVATALSEFDNALSGGIDIGSLVLLGGEPGIGKSTLTLQICDAFIKQNKSVLYVSGEEGLNQVAGRAYRLSSALGAMQFIQEYSVEKITATAKEQKPDLLVIDSIQVIHSEDLTGSAGSISQVRLCTEIIMEYCKRNSATAIIIGHVTKEGSLAGPRVLEHLVDIVIQMEGSRTQDLRLVRILKNRFGPTNEVGVLEMAANGLQSISNPSEKMLAERPQNAIGSSLTCVMEGKRPLIVEIQALCTKTVFGYPKRSATGYDVNRLNMLIAVLQKYLRLDLINQDIYINIVGGFRVQDPAADLAVCAAIISSLKQKALPAELVYLGEVGLSGEIRKSYMLERRIKEISNVGLKTGDLLTRVSGLI